MGVLAFLGLWGYLFTQVQKVKLPFPWTLGISFVITYVAAMQLSDILMRLMIVLRQPVMSWLLLLGLLSVGVCGGSILYLRRQYQLRKDPFKHLR